MRRYGDTVEAIILTTMNRRHVRAHRRRNEVNSERPRKPPGSVNAALWESPVVT